jgi:hypothetical protein
MSRDGVFRLRRVVACDGSDVIASDWDLVTRPSTASIAIAFHGLVGGQALDCHEQFGILGNY